MGITGFLDVMNDHEILKKSEEITGVNINWIEISTPVAQEQFNIMLASGDWADMIFQGLTYFGSKGDLAVDDEIYLRLNELIEEYAPNYNLILQTDDELSSSVQTDAGNIVAFYILDENIKEIDFGNITRSDLLEAANLDIPVTYDDWYEMLKAYKTLGVVYPTVQIGEINSAFVAGFGIPLSLNTMFSSYTSFFYQIDGKVQNSWLSDGYQKYLETVNKWYAEGLVLDSYADPVPLSTGLARQYSGDAGVWGGYADSMSLYAVNTAVPGSTTVGLPEPVLNEGDTIHIGPLATRIGRDCATISTACKYPELALGWLDFFYGGYGSFLVNWGFEGEAFEYGNDGVPYYTDLIISNPNEMTFENACNLYTGRQFPGYFNSERNTWHFQDNQKDAIERWNSNRDDAYVIPSFVSMTAAESEEFAVLFSDLLTFYQENNVKFINGDRPLSELESFRSQLQEMNLQRCIDIVQAAYDRFVLR